MTPPPRSLRSAPLIPIIALALLLAGFETRAATTSTGAAAAGHYDRAVQLIAGHDYRGAIIELKNALQADPNDLSARILLGRTYLKLEDGASAAKELTRARQNGARDNFILAPLGRAYLLQGLYGNAISILRAAGQDDATATEIAVVRGDTHLALLDYAAAADSYSEALKRQPGEPKAMIGLARVNVGLGKLDEAARLTKEASDRNSDDPEIWYVRGEILRQLKQPDAALDSYGRAIRLAPKFVRALIARANIHIDNGQIAEAEADIAKVRQMQPDNPEAIYIDALLLAQRGEIEAAHKLLIDAENILSTYPTQYVEATPPLLLLSGIVSYFRKNYSTAHSYLSLYLSKVPQHLGARKLLASMALKRGETERAIELLSFLAPRLPEDVEVMTMYGDALLRAGRQAEATAVFEKASAIAKPGSSALSKLLLLQLVGGEAVDAISRLKAEMQRDPGTVTTGLMLIGAQMRSGNYEAAMATAKEVIKHHPENPVVHNLSAGVYLGLRDIDGARGSFQKAIEAAPAYLPAMFNLAKLETRLGNLDTARQHYNRILDIDPLNGEAMFALSEIDQRRGDMDSAFRWLDKARTSSRNTDLATLRLVDLYLAANRTDDAVLAATQLNKAEPANLTYLSALGRALLGARQIEKAGDRFRELAERGVERKSPAWLYEAAVWLGRARDLKEARAALEHALKIDRAYLPAHLELFRMDMAERNLNGASARADEVAALYPKSPAADTLRGDLQMQKGEFAEAERSFVAAFEKEASTPLARRIYGARRAAGKNALEFIAGWAAQRKNDAGAQRLLAAGHGDAGNAKEALAIYEHLVGTAPADVGLLNNMALLYDRLNDPRALEFAKRAYDAAPEQPAIMDTYGWILVRSGETARGLRLLRNAHFRLPDVPEIRYHMAVALRAQGQNDDAIRELREALSSAQPFSGRDEARRLLGELSSARQPARP